MRKRDAAAAPHTRTTARNKRLLIALAAIALAPVVLSYLAYYFFPRSARVNSSVSDRTVVTTIPSARAHVRKGAGAVWPFDSNRIAVFWATLGGCHCGERQYIAGEG